MPTLRDPPQPPIGRWGRFWRGVFVLGLGLVTWIMLMTSLSPDASRATHLRAWLLDPALGIVAATVVRGRRSRPMPVAAVTAVLATVAYSPAGAAVLALASVSARRRLHEIGALAVLSVLGGTVNAYVYPLKPDAQNSLLANAITALVSTGIIVLIGYNVGSRRELAREQAESAERDTVRRAAQAAAAERTRIAREMHDVLAHRISLVAMHAGALNYRSDLTREQMSEALRTIETNAHQALADLREVLGVLREPEASADGPEPPQPGIHDLPQLIAETEGLGTRITYSDTTVGEIPPALGRTAYRVVQEALTNARKHAPGTTIRVSVSGNAPAGLQVEVRNPRSLQPIDEALPRSGLGLLGVRERVSLAGGKLRHGVQPDGGYAVHAWLPWPAPDSRRSA